MPKDKWVTATQIARKLREPVRSVAARLGIMRTAKEVEGRDTGGEIGFRPLVETTQPKMPMNPTAVQAMNVANRRRGDSMHDTDTLTTYQPGYVKHEGSRRSTPLPSPQGQGAAPLAFGIQSALG